MRRRVASALFACVLAASSVAGAEPSPPSAQAAQELYTAGRESYRIALYGRALEEFERSNALAPSPNARLYIARSLRELGRWSEAADQYRTTIREAEERGPKYTPTREAAEIELRDVEVRLARAPAPAAPEAPSDPATAPPPALAHTPPPEPARAPHTTTLTWIAGGAAIGTAAAGALLYGLASNHYSYLEDHCRTARDASCDDARTTGRREEVASYVVLGVATALAAVTVVSVFTSGAPKRTGQAPWPLAF